MLAINWRLRVLLKLPVAKPFDFGNDIKAAFTGHLHGNAIAFGGSHANKDDAITLGLAVDGWITGVITDHTKIKASTSLTSNNTKRYGEEDYNGTIDLSGRATLEQGFGTETALSPFFFGEVGAARLGMIKDQADVSTGFGADFSRELWGKHMGVQGVLVSAACGKVCMMAKIMVP